MRCAHVSGSVCPLCNHTQLYSCPCKTHFNIPEAISLDPPLIHMHHDSEARPTATPRPRTLLHTFSKQSPCFHLLPFPFPTPSRFSQIRETRCHHPQLASIRMSRPEQRFATMLLSLG
ncbi:hypothetical protein T440DRAFT_216596 [Plenodomus tracheiphilus IPT5]|uniref:Uncharacterized protein n=1 Tax=Plenodomus tracheiphilus IPT5 TaxID=1408161 RepID=A0A6A7AUV2_9PLEO|nr:hypothetical protein T440DRAFT_216596 [Plenodomus tracheiphilus IPT5]